MEESSENSLQKIFAQIARFHFLISQQGLEKMELYPGQPQMLLTLYKSDGRSQRELSESLMIKPATVTVMIKRLEKTGFVERKDDKKDQRISRIFLTEKGKNICENLKEMHAEIEKKCFYNFTLEEKILLRRFLIQVRDNLNDVYNEVKNKGNIKK